MTAQARLGCSGGILVADLSEFFREGKEVIGPTDHLIATAGRRNNSARASLVTGKGGFIW